MTLTPELLTRNVDTVADAITGPWRPLVLAALNDYVVKIARFEGPFVWHRHPDTDELFLVVSGEVDLQVRDDTGEERSVRLVERDTFVVPRGMMHRPVSPGGATVLLVEPEGTTNTGEFEGSLPEGIETTQGHRIDG